MLGRRAASRQGYKIYFRSWTDERAGFGGDVIFGFFVVAFYRIGRWAVVKIAFDRVEYRFYFFDQIWFKVPRFLGKWLFDHESGLIVERFLGCEIIRSEDASR